MRYWITILISLTFFIVAALCMEQMPQFTKMKAAMQSRQLPNSHLRFGAFGDILRELGLVIAVPNDYTVYPRSEKTEDANYHSIFPKKRKVREYN